jgi:hypothetical protein
MPVPSSFVDLGRTIQPVVNEPEKVDEPKPKVKRVSKAVKKSLESKLPKIEPIPVPEPVKPEPVPEPVKPVEEKTTHKRFVKGSPEALAWSQKMRDAKAAKKAAKSEKMMD